MKSIRELVIRYRSIALILCAFLFVILASTQFSAARSPELVISDSAGTPAQGRKAISPYLLGQDLDGPIYVSSINTPDSKFAKIIDVAVGLRGPSSGLYGEFYHWQDPLGVNPNATPDRRRTALPTATHTTNTPTSTLIATLTPSPTATPTRTPTSTATPLPLTFSGYTFDTASNNAPINGVPIELQGEYLLKGMLAGQILVTPQTNASYVHILHIISDESQAEFQTGSFSIERATQIPRPYQLELPPGSYRGYVEIRWGLDGVLYSPVNQFAISSSEVTTINWTASMTAQPSLVSGNPLDYRRGYHSITFKSVLSGQATGYETMPGFYNFTVAWNNVPQLPVDGVRWTQWRLVARAYGDSRFISAGPVTSPGSVLDDHTIVYPWQLAAANYQQNNFSLNIKAVPQATATLYLTPTPQATTTLSPTPTPTLIVYIETPFPRGYIAGGSGSDAIPTLTCNPQFTQGEVTNVIGTLDLLRLARDNNLMFSTVVNTRGIPNWYCFPDKSSSAICNNQNYYVSTDLEALRTLVADWEFYTRYVVQHFSQDHLPDPNSPDPLERRSAEILAGIYWQNCDGSNVRDKLFAANEPIFTQGILYWEIGNEPNYNLAGVTYSPTEFVPIYGIWDRGTPIPPGTPQYPGISSALLDLNLTMSGTPVKVGPSLMVVEDGKPDAHAAYLRELNRHDVHMDFVSYHPYMEIFTTGTPPPGNATLWSPENRNFLRSQISQINNFQFDLAEEIRNASGNNDIELIASEWNPSSWRSSYWRIWRARSIAHSLATLETLFAFARAGVSQAYYFTNPYLGFEETPNYQLFGYLKQHGGLGDWLLK